MFKTVVALYDDVTVAKQAVEKLVNNGFTRDNISLLANDVSNEYSSYLDRSGTGYTEDAVTASEGAGFGATVGALTGILVGLGAFMIPGIGPIIGAGPLIAGLTGGVVGAVAGGATGGLVGGLVKTGVASDDAEYYAEGVRRGGTLVVIHTPDDLSQQARDVLNDFHPVDVNTRLTEWRQDGWKAFDPTSEPYTVDQIKTFRQTERPVARTTVDTTVNTLPSSSMSNRIGTQQTTSAPYGFEGYDADFRNHFKTSLSSNGYTYDQVLPVYRYGYDLASDERYRDGDWAVVEPEARRSWETRNPGNSWENFKDAIRYAWDSVRGKNTVYTG